MKDLLSYYIDQFNTLKVDRTKGESAPHKPILLLSIIQLIEDNTLQENKIYINQQLISMFNSKWDKLVKSNIFIPKLFLPFYHLNTSGFWHLHPYPEKSVLFSISHPIRSFNQLKEIIWYASFDAELFTLLQKNTEREKLKQALSRSYFS